MTDEGIILIDNLMKDDKLYEHVVADKLEVRLYANIDYDSGDGVVKAGSKLNRTMTWDLSGDKSQVMITSKNIKGTNPARTTQNKYYSAPLDDEVDAQVGIVGRAKYKTKTIYDPEKEKPRSALVFHELWEMYLRTHGEGMPRLQEGGKGAHDIAVDKEKSLKEDDTRRDVGGEGAVYK